MADLRVKLILDLINRLSGPARAARGDLKGVGTEAKALDKVKAGGRISRDILAIGSAGQKAAGSVKAVGRSAGEAAREVERLQRKLTGLKVPGSAERQVLALRRQIKQQQVVAGQMESGSPGGAGAGAAVGGAAALGRRALLPLGVAAGGYAGVRGTVGQSVSFEKSMSEVKKKVDLPEGASFAALEREISSMAIAMGRAREDIAAVVAEAGAAGVAFNDLTGFTRLATKASVAWDMSSREAAQKLFEIRAATGKTLPALEDYVDKVNALGDTSAAKERDILEMSGRSIATAKEAGVSEETTLAFLTAMRSAGIGEEVGARGFNALASKMASADRSKKISEGLKEIGLNAKVMAKTMRTDATKALTELFTALDKAKNPVGSAVDIFGQEWFDEMLRTKGTIAEVRKNLEMLRDPSKWKGSADKSLNIELATTSNHLERLKSLASEVGDRLGRWALPAINEGIERVLAGMKALDARADQASQEQETGGKIADGKPLTAAERERLARDKQFADGVGQVVAGKREDRRNLSVTDQARITELMAERDRMQASLDQRRRNGAPEDQLAYSIGKLADIVGQLQSLDPDQFGADPRRPADQEERGRADRGEALALQTRVAQIEARIKVLDQLSTTVSNPADRKAFAGDAEAERRRLGRTLAPDAIPAGKFGFGAGGSPAGQKPTGPGPGLLSFGTGGAKAIKDAFTIDLGPAGMTMAEQLASGFRSGQGQIDGAADASGQAVRGRLASVDLTSAGQQIMQGFAAGIRAGGDQAVREAQNVANRVKAAASGGGGRGGLTGALHDGVPT